MFLSIFSGNIWFTTYSIIWLHTLIRSYIAYFGWTSPYLLNTACLWWIFSVSSEIWAGFIKKLLYYTKFCHDFANTWKFLLVELKSDLWTLQIKDTKIWTCFIFVSICCYYVYNCSCYTFDIIYILQVYTGQGSHTIFWEIPWLSQVVENNLPRFTIRNKQLNLALQYRRLAPLI